MSLKRLNQIVTQKLRSAGKKTIPRTGSNVFNTEKKINFQLFQTLRASANFPSTTKVSTVPNQNNLTQTSSSHRELNCFILFWLR